MAITANVTNGKLDKTNTTPTQNRKTSSAKASGSNLGYDDFLKLLSAEMQYQDPLEPTSNTDYVAQMATFSQLEATLSMKESMASSNDQTTKSAALSLVGKEVIVTDKDSASGYYSGKVDYVTYKDGKIQLSINEKMYDYSSLYSVSTDEYYDAIVNSSTFSSLIAKLPKIEDLTIDSKGSIEEARKLYDGLSDYGKQFINASDYSKLQAYEDKLKELMFYTYLHTKDNCLREAALEYFSRLKYQNVDLNNCEDILLIKRPNGKGYNTKYGIQCESCVEKLDENKSTGDSLNCIDEKNDDWISKYLSGVEKEIND